MCSRDCSAGCYSLKRMGAGKKKEMIRMFFKAVASVALVVLFTLTGLAQETPEAVAQAYVEASRNSDWPKAFGYLHPEALAKFKRAFEPLFATEKGQQGAEIMFGIKTRAEFDQLSGGQLMEKLMGTIGKSMPGFEQLLGKMELKVIGSVQETPDIVHLVCRAKVPMDGMQIKNAPNITKDVNFSKMEVVSLQRYETTWRVLLSAELEGMAQMLSNMFGAMGQEKAPESAPSEEPSKERKPPARKKSGQN